MNQYQPHILLHECEKCHIKSPHLDDFNDDLICLKCAGNGGVKGW